MNITVYLGSNYGKDPSMKTAVRELGTWIGKNHHTLIYGGSKRGLMGEYDRYFAVMEPRLEAVREGRSSTIDLWLCEGGRKQYLKTVEMNQVMLEVTAMRAKHNR